MWVGVGVNPTLAANLSGLEYLRRCTNVWSATTCALVRISLRATAAMPEGRDCAVRKGAGLDSPRCAPICCGRFPAKMRQE